MKTRKRSKKRKGGLFGFRALKTKTENMYNCHRLANNFTKRSEFLYNKYKCSTREHKDECKVINRKVGLYEQCARNEKLIDDYDFSGDGLHVKQRLQAFLGSEKVPSDVTGQPWEDLYFHFKRHPLLREYELKTEDEITQKYNDKINGRA
jgi:hypothetical protein